MAESDQIPGLNFILLGPPKVAIDDVPIEINRHKSIALLAYLALNDQEHHRDALATMFWPESSQSRARASLRRNLSTLNKELGANWLVSEGDTIALQREGVWIDVIQFRKLIAGCSTHGHESFQVCSACLDPLSEALDLYQDDFMAGFSLPDSPDFDEWQFFLGDALRQEAFSIAERLVQGYHDNGNFDLALNYARRKITIDPLHEPTHRQLMELYALTGQRSAALRQYHIFSQKLEEELDLPPDPETAALFEEIRTSSQSGGLLGKESSILVQHGQDSFEGMNNLPIPITKFIGRVEGLTEIAGLLKDPDCRLLTLTGPGGIGKTRLAIQAAQNLVDNQRDRHIIRDGVLFVRLASVRTSTKLLSAIAEEIELSASTKVDLQESLLSFLLEKNMLIILDSFEHLLNEDQNVQLEKEDEILVEGKALGAVGMVSDVLQIVPGIKILVTSREALNLQGEWVYAVEGLSYPPKSDKAARDEIAALESFSAVQLFVQSARRVHPEFSFLDEQACVLTICRLVEGMPLALELAAAWLKVLSCPEIAREIENSLDVLSTSLRDVPYRHRSIRAVFEYSWQLLSPREQEIMRQLATFRGGFTQEAAEQVTGATLFEITALVEKSLLRPTKDGKFRTHALLRQFTLEKLEAKPQELKETLDRQENYHAS